MFLLAAMCTKQQYGEAGILLAVQQAISVLVLSGLVESCTSLLNRYRTESQIPKLFANAQMLLLLTAGVVSLLYLAACKTILASYLRGTSFIMHLSVLFTGILLARLTLASNLYRLDERHRASLYLKAIPIALCYGVGIIGILLSKDKLTGFFVGSLVGLVLAEGFARRMALSRVTGPRLTSHFGTIRSLMEGALPMLPIITVNWLVGYGANFLIGGRFSKSEVGEFTFALTLNSVLLLALNSINQVWSPRFFKIAHEHTAENLDCLNGIMSEAMLLIASVVIGIILLLYVNAMNFMGGNLRSYTSLHPYLLLTFSSFIVLTLYYRCINYFYLHGKQYVYMNIFIASGVIGLPVWWLMMKYMGKPGIYGGYCLCMILRALFVFVYARRKWGVRLTIEEIPATLLVVIAGYGLSSTGGNLLLRLFAFVFIVFVVTYFLWFMNRKMLLNLKLLRV
jgi:O-antigen/teichoic acid export membrane protein